MVCVADACMVCYFTPLCDGKLLATGKINV